MNTCTFGEDRNGAVSNIPLQDSNERWWSKPPCPIFTQAMHAASFEVFFAISAAIVRRKPCLCYALFSALC